MSVSLSCKTCNYNSMPAYNAATGRYPIKYLSTHFYSKGVREPQASMYRVEKKSQTYCNLKGLPGVTSVVRHYQITL